MSDEDAAGPGGAGSTGAAGAADPADLGADALLSPEDEAAVRDLLASLPDPELPGDVGARIAAALADEPTVLPATVPTPTDVLPSTAPERSRRRSSVLLQSAAVLVLVALVGAVVVGAVRHHGGGSTAPVAAGPVTVSGRNYAPATLAGQVRGLLVMASEAATAPAAAPATGAAPLAAPASPDRSSAPRPSAATTGPSSAATVAGIAALAALVHDRAELTACIARLTGSTAVPQLAVDVGRYDGRAAAVIVLPSAASAGTVDVWVVGPTCSNRDDPFPYRYERVPRP